jgi:hypothetical protein
VNSHHLFPVFLRVCRGAVGHHPSLSVTTDHTERTKQSKEAYGCARTRPAARGVEKKRSGFSLDGSRDVGNRTQRGESTSRDARSYPQWRRTGTKDGRNGRLGLGGRTGAERPGSEERERETAKQLAVVSHSAPFTGNTSMAGRGAEHGSKQSGQARSQNDVPWRWQFYSRGGVQQASSRIQS